MSQRKKIRRRNDQQELKPTLRDLYAIKRNIPERMLKLVKIRVTTWAEVGTLTMNPENPTEILIHPYDWEYLVADTQKQLGDKKTEPDKVYGIPVVKGDE